MTWVGVGEGGSFEYCCWDNPHKPQLNPSQPNTSAPVTPNPTPATHTPAHLKPFLVEGTRLRMHEHSFRCKWFFCPQKILGVEKLIFPRVGDEVVVNSVIELLPTPATHFQAGDLSLFWSTRWEVV